MSSILNRVKIGAGKTGARTSGRPPAAVEITPEGVLAAALPTSGGEPQFAFAPLVSDTVVPGIDEPNLRSPEAVADAIRAALDQLSLRSRYVSIVLPDSSVRVFVLDFDALPAKPVEAIPVLRFRLRKMVPFDVEHAGASYQVLSESRSECKVLAAVVPGPILAEYEAAVRAAGYEPGAVLPSSLAAIEMADAIEARLSANLTHHALTTTIVNGQDLLLYRTIELPEDAGLRLAEVQRGIAVASAYFEDKLQVKPRRIYYAGTEAAGEFAGWIRHSGQRDSGQQDSGQMDPDLTVVEIAPRPEVGAVSPLGNASIAGVAGALVGVS